MKGIDVSKYQGSIDWQKVKAENLGEAKRHERHDGVLSHSAKQDVPRTLHEVPQILRRNRKPHAEHDDTQNDGTDVAMDPAEKNRDKERHNGAGDNDRRCVSREKTADSPDDIKHA